jgi:hypothetical protein
MNRICFLIINTEINHINFRVTRQVLTSLFSSSFSSFCSSFKSYILFSLDSEDCSLKSYLIYRSYSSLV